MGINHLLRVSGLIVAFLAVANGGDAFAKESSVKAAASSTCIFEWAWSASPFVSDESLCLDAIEYTNAKMREICDGPISQITVSQEIIKFAPPGWLCGYFTCFQCGAPQA